MRADRTLNEASAHQDAYRKDRPVKVEQVEALVAQWQKDQSEFFQGDILEIVTEYATWRETHSPQAQTAGDVERVARAICEASGEAWREGTYEVHSGSNFEVEEHSLDPFNNHWRHKARAAIAALQPSPITKSTGE